MMPIGDPWDGFFYLTLMIQDSHRLGNFLNIHDCLEKVLKIKFALKVLDKHSKTLKSP